MLNANMRQRLSGIARSLFVAVLMFATLFPFYWTLLISLKNQSDAFQVPPDLIFMPTLENYEELFVTGSFGRYFFNSFVVCVLSIILALLVGIPSAYILSKIGGLHIVWWAFPIAEVISFIVSTAFLIKIYKTIISKIPEGKL